MPRRSTPLLVLSAAAAFSGCGPASELPQTPTSHGAQAATSARPGPGSTASSQVPPRACTELDFDDCKAACSKGVAHACTLAGQSVEEDRRGEPAQKAQIVALLEKGCDGGDQEGCLALGHHYRSGEGAPKDPTKSDALYQKAFAAFKSSCDKGRAHGCQLQGRMTGQGWGATKSESEEKRLGKQAVDLFEAACGTGDGASCAVVGEQYQIGFYLPEDDAKATKLLTAGCGHDDAQSCFLLGLGPMFGVKGVAKDTALAGKGLAKACDLGLLKGCAALAELRAKGDGVPKDGPAALSLYERACHGPGEMLDAPACHDAAQLRIALGEAPSSAKVMELEKRSCLLGFDNGCQAIHPKK